ncbi:MAG: type II secretion system minor pseudopilin GspH [Vibrio sp.]
MRAERGFTLIEIMLVLVLLALSSVAVISTLPSSQSDLAETTARRFYQHMQLMNEESVLSGVDYGLRVEAAATPPTLTFLELTAKGWEQVKRPQFSARLTLDERLSMDFHVGGSAWSQDDDRLFEDKPLFDENMFAKEEQKAQQQPAPQVDILSSGETTPFTVSFYLTEQDEQQAWRVEVKENGQIVLHPPGEGRNE